MLGNANSREDIPAIQQEVSEITTSGEYTRYEMKKQWPVYLTYFTMAYDGIGRLQTHADIYSLDAKMAQALFGKSEVHQVDSIAIHLGQLIQTHLSGITTDA